MAKDESSTLEAQKKVEAEWLRREKCCGSAY